MPDYQHSCNYDLRTKAKTALASLKGDIISLGSRILNKTCRKKYLFVKFNRLFFLYLAVCLVGFFKLGVSEVNHHIPQAFYSYLLVCTSVWICKMTCLYFKESLGRSEILKYSFPFKSDFLGHTRHLLG